ERDVINLEELSEIGGLITVLFTDCLGECETGLIVGMCFAHEVLEYALRAFKGITFIDIFYKLNNSSIWQEKPIFINKIGHIIIMHPLGQNQCKLNVKVPKILKNLAIRLIYESKKLFIQKYHKLSYATCLLFRVSIHRLELGSEIHIMVLNFDGYNINIMKHRVQGLLGNLCIRIGTRTLGDRSTLDNKSGHQMRNKNITLTMPLGI
ncbi:hypothetical protein ACJX0J_033982, partial [Zea mays]